MTASWTARAQRTLFAFATFTFLLVLVPPTARAAPDPAAVQRGAYIFEAADCVGCHTDAKNSGPRLAGGRALTTPFGVFYSPNITPDQETGIGKWSLDDFHRALREGLSEHGAYYFPVFPYTSFTGISDQDIVDLFAYLQTQEPVKQAGKRHDVRPPFSWRFLQFGWRELFFTPGPLLPVPRKDAAWNPGHYPPNPAPPSRRCHT